MHKMKRETIIATVFSAFILALVVIAFVIVDNSAITVKLEETGLTVDAIAFHEEVAYEDISSVELRQEFDYGTRTIGVGTFRAEIGQLHNEEFGDYRGALKKDSPCIVLLLRDGRHIVFNTDDTVETSALYEDILLRVS